MQLNLDQLFALVAILGGSFLFGTGVSALYLEYKENTFFLVACAGFIITVIGAYAISASAEK